MNNNHGPSVLPTEVPRVYEETMSYQDPLVVQTEESISLGGSENHYELLTEDGNEEKYYQELSVLPAEGTRVYELPSLQAVRSAEVGKGPEFY